METIDYVGITCMVFAVLFFIRMVRKENKWIKKQMKKDKKNGTFDIRCYM